MYSIALYTNALPFLLVYVIVSQCFAGGSSSSSVLRFLFTAVLADAFFPGPQCLGFSWYLTNFTLAEAVTDRGCLQKLATVLCPWIAWATYLYLSSKGTYSGSFASKRWVGDFSDILSVLMGWSFTHDRNISYNSRCEAFVFKEPGQAWERDILWPALRSADLYKLYKR